MSIRVLVSSGGGPDAVRAKLADAAIAVRDIEITGGVDGNSLGHTQSRSVEIWTAVETGELVDGSIRGNLEQISPGLGYEDVAHRVGSDTLRLACVRQNRADGA